MVKAFFYDGHMHKEINHTFIILIPNSDNPKSSIHYSLSAYAYKIIAYPKSKSGYMTIKLDMKITYDKVEWDFIKVILFKIGFHPKWIEWVIKKAFPQFQRIPNRCFESLSSFSWLLLWIPKEHPVLLSEVNNTFLYEHQCNIVSIALRLDG